MARDPAEELDGRGGVAGALTTIAELRPPGVNVGQISSHDRTGGNADLGLGPESSTLLAPFGVPPVVLDNSFLYRDGERYVIFRKRELPARSSSLR